MASCESSILAHGTLYALGAYVMRGGCWARRGVGSEPFYSHRVLAGGPVAVAATGAVVEPLLLRPVPRAEEYQLLLTFGLLLMLEDVMRYIWGRHLSPRVRCGRHLHPALVGRTYPAYNVVVIILGLLAALMLWALIFKTRFA